MKPIETDSYSARLRPKAVDPGTRRLLIARLAGSDQEPDLTKPPNCTGLGRVRHFRRHHGTDWPRNPLPIDPACRALHLESPDELQAQVFQNAACNWRCWYCFVPFVLLDASERVAEWKSADELVDLYLSEPVGSRPRMIDLTGGQPDLVPEWVPWMMSALRNRGLHQSVYLWSDDNLSNDYFWTHLTEEDRELVATFPMYGRVACFKGFDAESFAFNTLAAPELFERQFDLFARLMATGMDLYAYTTFTAPSAACIEDAMPRFVDRLQEIHHNLPLRTVPLKIAVFGVVDRRLATFGSNRARQCREAEAHQFRAVEAWNAELERRFTSDERSRAIVDVPLGPR